jgi:D-ribose pyranase
MIETVDISLIDDIPTVLQVFNALKTNFNIGQIYMAEEFQLNNSPKTLQLFESTRGMIPVKFEPHAELKLRVPKAIGLIRTGDSTQYANIILESA